MASVAILAELVKKVMFMHIFCNVDNQYYYAIQFELHVNAALAEIKNRKGW
jgi:hypothetical protein